MRGRLCENSVNQLPTARRASLPVMSASLVVLDILVRGAAVGALISVAVATGSSAAPRQMRLVAALFFASVAAWLIVASAPASAALGPGFLVLLPLAFPVAGLFWLFVVVLFEDRRATIATTAPAILLVVTGVMAAMTSPVIATPIWTARDLAGALLAVHAGAVIVRGWRDDLVETRRRLRGPFLIAMALFSAVELAAAIATRYAPHGPWLALSGSGLLGPLVLLVIVICFAAVFLGIRVELFGAPRPASLVADSRMETADRLDMERLKAVMDDGQPWRQEGFAIGVLANAVGVPEHRLRRLINFRLGCRNYAEFLNGYRIEAAKLRLADPREARTTVAAIAFDLGYGSLSPFNRAFRGAIGTTPTEWRAQALADTPANSRDPD